MGAEKVEGQSGQKRDGSEEDGIAPLEPLQPDRQDEDPQRDPVNADQEPGHLGPGAGSWRAGLMAFQAGSRRAELAVFRTGCC